MELSTCGVIFSTKSKAEELKQLFSVYTVLGLRVIEISGKGALFLETVLLGYLFHDTCALFMIQMSLWSP